MYQIRQRLAPHLLQFVGISPPIRRDLKKCYTSFITVSNTYYIHIYILRTCYLLCYSSFFWEKPLFYKYSIGLFVADKDNQVNK